MFRHAILAALLLPGALWAQDIKIRPGLNSQEAAEAFAIKPPDEGSPFFMEREMAKFAVSQEGQKLAAEDTVSVYPKAKDSSNSVGAYFTHFFTDMFSSIKLRKWRNTPTSQKILIEPPQFSLADRREINVTYTIHNNTRKILRIDYPSTQRVEIITRDPEEKIIEKWSDDRAFEEREGVVFINPNERIEYSEKVPTRDMKADLTYSVEGSVPNNPQYTHRHLVTPGP